MMIILFIIILIIILIYYLFIYREQFQSNPNIIKGQELDLITVADTLPDIYVGDVNNPDYITYITKFYLKIFIPKPSVNSFNQKDDEFYLNNSGTMCDKNITSSICLKRNSDVVNEVVFKKKQTDSDSENLNSYTQSGLWQFHNLQTNNSDYVYYGQEVLIRNLSNNTYISICDEDLENFDSVKCGKKLNIYCYNNIDDAMDYGKWIIIPKYFDKFKSSGVVKTNSKIGGNDILERESSTSLEYDFYETYNNDGPPDTYDFVELNTKNIKIKMDDNFLIINSKLINDKYVYLNFCNNSNISITCNQQNDDINKETTFKKAIGSLPTATPLVNFENQDVYIYNWSIQPIKYDVNVYDTLFVEGSITLGGGDNAVEITSDTLRYIKQIPFHFDKEICLQDKDGRNQNPTCINKEHIEMLNGSRAINIKSVTPAKPFILYSSDNYTGRELRVGFDYDKLNNLPYIGGYNEWLNWNNNGRWYSLKIEGSYSAIICSKANFGHGDNIYNDTQQTLADIQEALKDRAEHQLASAAAAASANNAAANNAAANNAAANNAAANNAAANNAATNNAANNADANNAANNTANNNNTYVNTDITSAMLKMSTNPNIKIIEPPGIADVREFGDEWVEGIRSMIVRYKDTNGEYKEIISNNTYELKCIEKYPFTYNPNVSFHDSLTKNLFTANLCENGNKNQNFFLISDNDDKFTNDDSIYSEGHHKHFHRHDYAEIHDNIIGHQ